MADLSNKKALVTGAGMGIGQGIAIELARGGT
jgi:NAD(P)-dependent dehydrogenase (short-subunit alcohol dehydrogenase family)